MGKKNKKRRKRRKRRESRRVSPDIAASPHAGRTDIPSLRWFFQWAASVPEDTEGTRLFILGDAALNRIMDSAEELLNHNGTVDVYSDMWPFPRMYVAFKSLVQIDLEIARSWGFIESFEEPLDRVGLLGILFGAKVGDPTSMWMVCAGVASGGNKAKVGLRVVALVQKNAIALPETASFYLMLAGATLKEVKRGKPLNIDVKGGRPRTRAPEPSSKPLPEHFYPVSYGPSYAASEADPPTEPTGPKLRFRHDRRGSESVRVKRGNLPLSAKQRRHLEALEYRIYDDRNKKLSKADHQRLVRRGKRGRRPDEWFAIKSWWRRETVVGDDDLPYIPGLRS